MAETYRHVCAGLFHAGYALGRAEDCQACADRALAFQGDSPTMAPFTAIRHLPPPLTEHRRCPLCGADVPRMLLELAAFQWLCDGGPVTPLRDQVCQRCGLIYRSPILSASAFRRLDGVMDVSYANDYAAGQAAWCLSRSVIRPGQHVVDIGCGDGRFLAQLPQTVQRLGVDASAYAIGRGLRQYAVCGARPGTFAQALAPPLPPETALRTDFMLDVGGVEDFSRPDSRYTAVYWATMPVDVFTLFHVLEHVPDPKALLEGLARLGHADTRLVVEVPVLERGDTLDINGFFAPQHVTHFSTDTLRSLLMAAGWQIAESVLETRYNGYRVVATKHMPPMDVWCDRAPVDEALIKTYLGQLWTRLGQVSRCVVERVTASQVVIWGAGLHTECLYHQTPLFRGDAHRRWLLIDGDVQKYGRTWRGLPIQPSTALRGVNWTNAQLVVSSYGSEAAIVQEARALGVPADRMVTLYADRTS